MGLIDEQRRKLSQLVTPLLEVGETIDGQLTYGTTGSLGQWIVGAVATLAPGRALGIVVTSRRIALATWDGHGDPSLVGFIPRDSVAVTGLRRGFLSDTVSMRGPDGMELELTTSGFVRRDAATLATLLG